MEFDGGNGGDRRPPKGPGWGPAWARIRAVAAEAAIYAGDRIRDYDAPARIGVARDRVRAMELDRKAAALARIAARTARAGSAVALREGASGARAASRFAARHSASAAREAGPIARRAWDKAAGGVAALRLRRTRADRGLAPVAPIAIAPAVTVTAAAAPPADRPPLFPADLPRIVPPRVDPVATAPVAAEAAAGRRFGWLKGPRSQWLAAGGGLLIGASAMAVAATQADAPARGTPERAAIEAIVHDYILEHPEILPQAMERLQNRETARLLDSNRRAFEAPFAGAWAGAADGDVVMVEFFDYACGYCRQSVPDIDRLLAEDPKLKVVFRELPILGEESGDAAIVSLAAAKQGNFMAFHRAMYAAGRPSAATIERARATATLDAGKVAADRNGADIRGEIASNLALARTLGMSGTPTFIIGDKMLSGAVGYEELKSAVAEARAAR